MIEENIKYLYRLYLDKNGKYFLERQPVVYQNKTYILLKRQGTDKIDTIQRKWVRKNIDGIDFIDITPYSSVYMENRPGRELNIDTLAKLKMMDELEEQRSNLYLKKMKLKRDYDFKVKGIDSAIDSIEFEKDRLRKEMDSEGSEDSSQKD